MKSSSENRIYAMGRLLKDRPDLHARVVSGELTTHGAMVAAGFRLPRFTVQGSPSAAARTLAKQFRREDIISLIEALKGHLDTVG